MPGQSILALAATALMLVSVTGTQENLLRQATDRPRHAPAEPLATTDVLRGELGSRIDAILREATTTSGFGGAVIVELDGELVLQSGYGYADRERSIPFRADTVHAIGSITKPFTALAVVHLAQEGKLDLAAPVSRYLPDAAAPAASATLHQLLTHTSGMAEYCADDEARVTKSDLLKRCMAAPLVNAPGQKWAYSNPVYSVLAALVEQVAGEPIDDFLKKRFFVPLGLDRTGYRLPRFSSAGIAKQYLDGHLVPETPGIEVDGQHWQLVGNGGMQSSAIDMYHWYLAMRGVLPLDRGLATAIVAPRSPRGSNASATYGWVRLHDESGRPTYIGHDGSNGVFYATFLWRPQDGAFLYLIGNSGEDEVVKVIRRVRALLTERRAQPQASMK